MSLSEITSSSEEDRAAATDDSVAPVPVQAVSEPVPGPTRPPLRELHGRAAAVLVVATGALAFAVLSVLPLASAPVRRTRTAFGIVAGSDGLWWPLVVLICMLSCLAIAVAGAFMLTGSARVRRRCGIAAVLLAVVGLVSGLVLGSVSTLPDDSATGTVLGPDAALDVGSWLLVVALSGAVVGAVADLVAGAVSKRGGRRLEPALYVLLAVVALAVSVAVVVRGPAWSAGVLAGSGTPTVSATCIGVGSNDRFGAPTTFDPGNVVDGRPETAWRCEGDGTGEYVQIDFGGVRTLSEVSVIPGYAKVDSRDGADRYAQNRRVAAVRYTFSDGSSVEGRMRTDPAFRDFQAVSFPAKRTTGVTVTILASVEGMRVASTVSPTGTDGPRDYAAISEVRFR